MNYDMVQIHLQKVSGEKRFNLQALLFLVICSSLPNSVSLEQFPSLLKLDLTDPSCSSSEELDVLIGSDYYWNIVGEVIQTNGGPIVIKSKFGWLLSGPLAISEPPNTRVTHLSFCMLLDTLVQPELSQ